MAKQEEVKTKARVPAPEPESAPSQALATYASELPASNGRSYRERYLDEVSPATVDGRFIRFDGKEGMWLTPDDGEPVPEDAEYVVLAEEVLWGWIRFKGEGEPPDRRMGLYFDGFGPPERNSLGDLDKAEWETGLSGKPEDPWLFQICVPLQRVDTDELFVYATTSKTGRRAAVSLLRHFERIRHTYPDALPKVRLRVGSYKHPDDRVGIVRTPVLLPSGRTSSEMAVKPPQTTAELIGDDLPSSVK